MYRPKFLLAAHATYDAYTRNMKKSYVVAVSGGIDSVVLLDMMAKLPELDLVVAHFDHGIREDSIEDALFVEQLAKQYGLPFETARVELGSQASEELARRRRYEFLRGVMKKHDAGLATAHHGDDIIETIAINHIRGTGWRGLAVMGADIMRPLLHVSKEMIRDYALKRGLEWREDSTNASDAYLRNRLRRKLATLSPLTKKKLWLLRKKQLQLRGAIEAEVAGLIDESPYSRYLFTYATKEAALEMLRLITKAKLTRPQLERVLLAIKTYRPGTIYQAGNSVELQFTTRQFIVKLVE